MKTKVGELIKKGREEKNLSMRQLAELAKVSHSDISRIESGEREVPNPKILRKISNIIDVNYSDLMYSIGLGLEVTPLNYFIKNHYSNLNAEELETAEINVLGSIENSEKLVESCEKQLENENLSENEKELLIHTIEDNNYQIYIFGIYHGDKEYIDGTYEIEKEVFEEVLK